MKFNLYKYEFKIELESGLHIGGNKTGYDIGGADLPVIKDPLTSKPYIPGSSLKGKLRAMLLWSEKNVEVDNGDLAFKDNDLKRLFGDLRLEEQTRIIVRDCPLDNGDYIKEQLDGFYTEIKAENSINKIKGTAISPRFIERVPKGAIFSGEIIVNCFEDDNFETYKGYIEKGLGLLENNYLGGSGSRGYGKIKIIDSNWTEVQ